jgi:hypothetical protein
MSRRVISDATAKQLIRKLNRRMGAVSVLTRDPQSLSWPAIPLQGLISALPMCLLILSDGRWEYWVLSIGILVLWSLVEVYNAGLNRRIDALVELLQQEGMLHTQLPPDSAQEV